MSQAAQLAQQIVVQHREPGYLCLELPGELCTPAAATAIEQGLAGCAAIRSAAVDRRWQRISIRFDATACSTAEVARQLFALLDGLPDESAALASGTNTPAIGSEQPEPGLTPYGLQANGLQPLLDKIKGLLAPAVSNATPLGTLQAKIQPILESALTEKAIVNFFNDLVAFYLIKAHWELITKRWLQQPLAHSNAWMTTFYLVFLLVRYRKTQLQNQSQNQLPSQLKK